MRNQAEANLSALIASTEDLLWSVDRDFRLITFNRAFQKTFETSFGITPSGNVFIGLVASGESSDLSCPF
jgi:PAS domain-containing protein